MVAIGEEPNGGIVVRDLIKIEGGSELPPTNYARSPSNTLVAAAAIRKPGSQQRCSGLRKQADQRGECTTSETRLLSVRSGAMLTGRHGWDCCASLAASTKGSCPGSLVQISGGSGTSWSNMIRASAASSGDEAELNVAGRRPGRSRRIIWRPGADREATICRTASRLLQGSKWPGKTRYSHRSHLLPPASLPALIPINRRCISGIGSKRPAGGSSDQTETSPAKPERAARARGSNPCRQSTPTLNGAYAGA